MNNEIFLDNSSTTRPYNEVVEYMSSISKDYYGNPSSLHTKGIEAERMVKKARSSIAEVLKCDLKEVYFTSGGTESNNLAIRGYLDANRRKGKHIITTKVEHPSVLNVFEYLSNNGYEVDYLGVDERGLIDLNELEDKLRSDTSLISIIYVNNEVGTIEPINEIVKIKNTKSKDAVIHIDAVQAYGKLEICPKRLGIDLLSVSSHKIHGPKGVGALFVNKSIKINPIIFGGGQESLLRSGTENVPGICGFGMASELTMKNLRFNFDKIDEIKRYFLDKIKEKIDDFMIISPECSSPYILNVSFKGIKSEVLLHHLEFKNIYVSTGSACSSRKNIHSKVLKEMSIDSDYIEGAIRFSFSHTNTKEQMNIVVEEISKILSKIRRKTR